MAEAATAKAKKAREPSKEPSKAEAKEERLNPLSVDANRLIGLLAKELKSFPDVKPPDWAKFAKTGVHKERPPQEADWWYARAAAVLRSVAKLGLVGTAKLRTKYGGKHSRGHKSEHFAKGSGSIIRKVLQQLEKAGLVKQAVKGVHKGRAITKKASQLMDSIAVQCRKELMKETKEAKAEEAVARQPVKAKTEAADAESVKKATATGESIGERMNG